METRERIERVLEERVRPLLRSHGGGVKMTGYEDCIVFVKLSGVCVGCPSADLSTKGFIEDVLKKELPEIQKV